MKQSGFTFIELIVVFGVIGVMFMLVSVNLFRIQQKPALVGAVESLIADLRSQQAKTMSGVAYPPGGNADYGIYFAGNQYVLFRGSVYNAADSNNIVVSLSSPLTIVTSFPTNQIVFLKSSGQVRQGAPSTITIQNSQTGEQSVLHVNGLGAVESVN